MELVLVALAFLMLSLGILAAIGSRPFSSDDVAQENAIAQLAFHSQPRIDLPQNNYVLKLPAYATLNLVPLPPESRLIVTVIILDVAGFAIFYWAARSLATTFKYLWVSTVIPFLWLSMTGYQFADILANPNSRNLEIGVGFAAIALTARWYQTDRPFQSSLIAIGFTAALGLLFYNDPYFGYLVGLPLLGFFVLKWLLFGKDQKAVYLAVAMLAAFGFEQGWHYFFYTIGIHAGQPSSSFVALSDVPRNIGLFAISSINLFQANIFAQTIVSLHTLSAELNLIVLILFVLLPILLLRSKKVRETPWKILIAVLPLFTFLEFVSSSMVFNAGADHYLVILPFEAALIYMLAIGEAPTLRMRNLLLGLIGLATIFNVATAAQLYADRSHDLNSDNQAIAAIVESEHLTKGFASYWNAGINQYFADNRVVFIQTGCSPSLGVDVDKLLLNEQELGLSSRNSFYLFDPAATRCTSADLDRFFGKPERVLSLTYGKRILIYDYDITNRISAL